MNNQPVPSSEPFTKFRLKGDASVTVNVVECANTAHVDVKINHPDAVTVDQRIDSGTCVVSAARTYPKGVNGKKDFIGNLREAVAKDSLSALLGAVTKNILSGNLASDTGSQVTIELRVPQGFTDIELESENMDVSVIHSFLHRMSVKSTNLDFKSSEILDIDSLTITGTNSDVDLVVGGNMKHARIKGTNADIKIRRHSGYKGCVRVTGSNLDISGNLDGDATSGVVSCDVTNGDVMVVSI